MTQGFDPVLDSLVGPALDTLAIRLGSIPGLSNAERAAVRSGAGQALQDTVSLKLSRVLVREVNAARVRGRLTAPDPASRWEQWLSTATEERYWESLAGQYPTLLPRVHRLMANRCAAALAFAQRFAADRHALPALLPGEPELIEVEFGAGDSHLGGHTVARVRCAAGRLVYKPRSLAVDAALNRLLARLLSEESATGRIRVPAVLCRDGYGWAEHVNHRYCADDAELRAFYRGLGQWIAVMRLVSGSDLHAENLIAAGPVPVVVDCETLFTPHLHTEPSGYGLAVDRARDLVAGSVMRTGLLPGRGVALAWRGVDPSAVGALPGQQPSLTVPVLVDLGTDHVRLGFKVVPAAQAANHPSSEPVLAQYWSLSSDAFDELTGRLRDLDHQGRLESLLEEFSDCPIRIVTRATEAYAELSRMLWHPASLHDEPAARARAADLLSRQARNLPEASDDPAVIEAEIDDLLIGDTPMFTTTPSAGWAGVPDLVADALHRWRHADLELDRQVIRASLITAYLNETPATSVMPVTPVTPLRLRADDLDQRRRDLTAGVVRVLRDTAIRGEDGTATWIAPVLTPAGWAVQPLSPDMYLGTNGLAVLFAAYLHEVEAGRADPVDGLSELLDETLHTMRAAEDRWNADRAGDLLVRPQPCGGYVGLGSQIWGWLLLRRLGVGGDDALHRARILAEQVSDALRGDEALDLLRGAAGAIVPLLRLSEHDDDIRWVELATAVGKHLGSTVRLTGGHAWWPGQLGTDGLGGVSHGASGIGWALARLDHHAGAATARDLAEAAFRYEESLYDPDLPGWLDMRKPETPTDAAAWCHGAGGIGIVAADLLRRTGEQRWAGVLRRSAAVCVSKGMGANHTLCHGELGTWEVLRSAFDAGVAPPGLDRSTLDARILTGIEDFGAVAGPNRDAFRPGLLLGLGGIAYQLLRMHPRCALPSVLLPDPGPPGELGDG